MEDIVRGALAVIAIGGFVSVVVESNLLALKTLWRLNRLAAEMALVLAKGPLEHIIRKEQQQMAIEDADD